MKRKILLSALALFILLPCFGATCGDSTEQGAAGNDPMDGLSGDDDDDNMDPEGCEKGVNFVYDCGHYFLKDGQAQSLEEAYTECLALGEISNGWKCRLNCMHGATDCHMLFSCLELCPLP